MNANEHRQAGRVAREHRSWNAEFHSAQRAFTLVELVVVVAVVSLFAVMILPALARTRTHRPLMQCQNNLKQLAAAWMMYSTENQGRLVSAYPNYAGFQGTWCAGNASSGGSAGSYVYGGADPRGITNGLLWPYIKSFSPYKCPADNRIATGGPAQYIGKPILRSVAMSSFMAGTSFGVSPSWTATNPNGARNSNAPVFIRESEISRPSSIWVILDEDPQSINDGMFTVDMGGSRGFLDLPSRLHNNGYSINFADGRTEYIRLNEPTSLNWTPSATPTNDDWRRLTNITTTPLN